MILCRITKHTQKKKTLILSQIPSLWGQSTCSAAESWSVSQFSYLLSWNLGLITEFKQNYEETCSFVRYSYLTSFQELKFFPTTFKWIDQRNAEWKHSPGVSGCRTLHLGRPFWNIHWYKAKAEIRCFWRVKLGNNPPWYIYIWIFNLPGSWEVS